ncbi:MAG TPA: alginate lyase family protein [Phycisphaerae bacterium]|nr:alginate lyase family protein [Phycisphaerae bacterium]
MKRRLQNAMVLIFLCISLIFFTPIKSNAQTTPTSQATQGFSIPEDLLLFSPGQFEEKQVIAQADKDLTINPVTITSYDCPRNPGDRHEYYSEGTYWWPDPKNPNGPYIRRDGYENPGNFDADYNATELMSEQVATLTAAFMDTGDVQYADKAIEHLKAWFVNPVTRMAPNLEYAQAIKGINTGRGTGIIETQVLVKVAQSAKILEDNGVLAGADAQAVNQWFADYIHWLMNSPHGKDEMNAKNNHGTYWVLQVTAFARLTDDQKTLAFCRDRFKNVLIYQMAPNGSFPLELARTKPYAYSLFNLNAMCLICWILSSRQGDENLWNYSTPDGRNMKKAIAFLYPYIANRSIWPHKPDVEEWNQQPGCPPALLFGGFAYDVPEYIDLWKKLYPNWNKANQRLIGVAEIWFGGPVKW